MYLAPGSSPEFSLPDGVLQRRILEPSSTLEFAVALQSGETLGPLQGSVEFGTLNQPGLRFSIPVRLPTPGQKILLTYLFCWP